MIGLLSNDLDAIAHTITQFNLDKGLTQEQAIREALDLAIKIGIENNGDVYLSAKITVKLFNKIKELKKKGFTTKQIMKKTGLSKWQVEKYDN